MEALALFFGSAVRLSTPLLFASVGEVVSERAGGAQLEPGGMMLSAAFGAALGARASGSPVIGLACGVLAALLLALVQALLTVKLRANQLVSGIGLNLFALGATTFAYRQLFGGLSRDVIPSFSPWSVPGLSRVPLLGSSLFTQTPLVYVALALGVTTYLLVSRTRFGLTLRAVGENPRAADQAGISVARCRTWCVLYTGLCAGLGGAFLAVSSISTFTEGMTNGAGYLAVTAVILGGWRICPVMASCLLFGGAAGLQFLLPAVGVRLPTAVLVMLPYVLALLAVTGIAAASRPPAALTLPFQRGSH